MKTSPKKSPIKCPICGRKFVDQKKFGEHVDRHIMKELFAHVDAFPDEAKGFPA